jgi:hypothetical protein
MAAGRIRVYAIHTIMPVGIPVTAHMAAGRIRVYAAPCPSVGFGTCDAQFSEIFLGHQFNSFPLHKKARSDNWYLNVENMPQ